MEGGRTSRPGERVGHADDPKDWIEETRHLLAEVLRSDARDVEVVCGGFSFRVRRGAATRHGTAAAHSVQIAEPGPLDAILAPLTGVFYGAPSPGAPSYVRIGELVEIGAVIGLIEAMKVFNEVLADKAGIVARIVVPDGSLVRAGEHLILLDPNGAAPTGGGAGV